MTPSTEGGDDVAQLHAALCEAETSVSILSDANEALKDQRDLARAERDELLDTLHRLGARVLIGDFVRRDGTRGRFYVELPGPHSASVS